MVGGAANTLAAIPRAAVPNRIRWIGLVFIVISFCYFSQQLHADFCAGITLFLHREEVFAGS
jgi:hypothetical protein